jgi:hypothetical protein
MGIRLLLLLAATLGVQDADPEKIETLVKKLADDRIEVREKAEAALRARGEAAVPALEAAAQSDSPEIAARARRILATLRPFRIILKDGRSTLMAKDQPIPITISLENTSTENLIVRNRHFDVDVRLLELFEAPPEEGRRRGGTFGGRSSTGCHLSPSDFVTLAPSESMSTAVSDLREHHGLEIDEEILKKHPKISVINPVLAGRYRVTARYRYDRDAYVKLCPKDCPGHRDPTAVWNRCPERSLETRIEFSLR